jgi:glyoxalase-like protein
VSDDAAAIRFDHLVVACRTQVAGAAWCIETFGVAPEPGGRHPLMGTYNLLLNISSVRFPNAYLELISIDPGAPPPGEPRWFELDDAALQAALAEPRLVHWGARSNDIGAAFSRLQRAGHDLGRIVAAERMTPRGLLRWRITLPAGGRRPAAGAVPLIIEWAGVHPTDSLPASGVMLESLEVAGVSAETAALLGPQVTRSDGAAPLSALLSSPRGRVVLAAPARLSA